MLDPTDVGWPARLAFFCALAFGGALASLSVWPPKSRWVAFGNLFVGTLLSVVTTPAAIDIVAALWPSVPASEAIRGALYFWFGALGLQLIPVALGVVNLIKSVRFGGSAP